MPGISADSANNPQKDKVGIGFTLTRAGFGPAETNKINTALAGALGSEAGQPHIN
jgi:hypothetical protein